MRFPLACPAKNCVPLLLGTHSRTLHLVLSCMLSVLSCAAMIGRLLPAGACSCGRRDISITACSRQEQVSNQGQQTRRVWDPCTGAGSILTLRTVCPFIQCTPCCIGGLNMPSSPAPTPVLSPHRPCIIAVIVCFLSATLRDPWKLACRCLAADATCMLRMGVPPMPDSTTLCWGTTGMWPAVRAQTSLTAAHPRHSPAPLSSRSHLVLLCKHGSTDDHPAQLMG